MKKNKQTALLVLGMHRSGTSALTGVLSHLDIYLGNELMDADFGNTKGYFENSKLYKMNESLLSQIGSSWSDVFYNEKKLSKIENIDALKELLVQEFEYANIFAIKDPRLAYLFPLYKKVLDELDIEIKIILPYRNPIEVANSLHKRDKMVLEKGMLLWAYNFLLSEEFSRGYPRVFVSFDELIANNQKVVEEISSRLELDLAQKYSQNKSKIDTFLEPNLKHHNISVENLSENTPKILKDLLALQDRLNTDELIEQFDALREELFSYQKLFYNTGIAHTLKAGKRAEQDLQLHKSELAQKSKTCLALDKSLRAKEGELEQSKELIKAKEGELEQSKELFDTKQKELEQKKSECKMLRNSLQMKQRVLDEKMKQIDALQTELSGIYTGKSWRLTRPLRKLMKIFKGTR